MIPSCGSAPTRNSCKLEPGRHAAQENCPIRKVEGWQMSEADIVDNISANGCFDGVTQRTAQEQACRPSHLRKNRRNGKQDAAEEDPQNPKQSGTRPNCPPIEPDSASEDFQPRHSPKGNSRLRKA